MIGLAVKNVLLTVRWCQLTLAHHLDPVVLKNPERAIHLGSLLQEPLKCVMNQVYNAFNHGYGPQMNQVARYIRVSAKIFRSAILQCSKVFLGNSLVSV